MEVPCEGRLCNARAMLESRSSGFPGSCPAPAFLLTLFTRMPRGTVRGSLHALGTTDPGSQPAAQATHRQVTNMAQSNREKAALGINHAISAQRFRSTTPSTMNSGNATSTRRGRL